jgi:hypothetical protein
LPSSTRTSAHLQNKPTVIYDEVQCRPRSAIAGGVPSPADNIEDEIDDLGPEEEEAEYAFLTSAQFQGVSSEPQSYKEAIRSSSSLSWKKAMDLEIEAQLEAGTWTLVLRDPSMNVIKCRWVFKLKTPIPPLLDLTFKARLVAMGFLQILAFTILKPIHPRATLLQSTSSSIGHAGINMSYIIWMSRLPF